MKYIIKRTSIWEEEKPCDGAVQEDVIYWDVRTCSKIELMARRIEKNWQEYEDFLHNGYTWCRKKNKDTVWTMDIDDLQKFAQEVNCKIVVFPRCEDDEYEIPVVEIYDTWRE